MNQVAILTGQYRKDDAHDPGMYAAAVSALFSDYPRDVVEYATDPRTGFATRYKWLPQVFEVREFLEELMKPRRERAAAAEKSKRTATQADSAPLPKHRGRPMLIANLFVPVGVPGYDAMLARHEETNGVHSCFERGVPTMSGGIKDGLWVPAEWYNGPGARAGYYGKSADEGLARAEQMAADMKAAAPRPVPPMEREKTVGDFGV